MLLLFFLLILLSPITTQAQLSLTESFVSTSYLDPSNTTLVWNSYFHFIHPPLAISYTSGANNEDSLDASVGLGTNGVFDTWTYAQYSTGGVTPGNVITINTTVFPLLQFTYFNLAQGWTIRGVGSNPLWIESLGPVTIAGTIDCTGDPGQNVDFITTSPTTGGAGHCGGGNGGSGGYATGFATAGTSGGGTTTGGSPALDTAGSGGGGGASFRTFTSGGPTAGSGPAPGTFGTNFSDPKFTVFGIGIGGGGSGGGGGSYNNVALSRGGGGGGGGGVVRITSIGDITITSTGLIHTAGGAGGGGTGPGGGGGGGGGAGGIWLQTPGTIWNNGVAPYYGIDAGVQSGAPDNSNAGVVTGGNNGGRGSDGRTWLTSQLVGDGASPPGNESPISELYSGVPFDEGCIHYSVGAGYVAQSLSYDALNTSPTYLTFLKGVNQFGAGTTNILVAGSSDNFVTDNTGFISLSSISTMATKRYFKFQVSIQQDPATFASTPEAVTSVTAVYNGVEQNNFNFSAACGYLGGGPWEGLALLGEFALIYFFYFFTSERRRKTWLVLRPNMKDRPR